LQQQTHDTHTHSKNALISQFCFVVFFKKECILNPFLYYSQTRRSISTMFGRIALALALAFPVCCVYLSQNQQRDVAAIFDAVCGTSTADYCVHDWSQFDCGRHPAYNVNGGVNANRVACEDGEVVYISYQRQDLAGTLPTMFGGSLSLLRRLSFSTNSIGGTLPTSVQQLTSLQILDFRKNRLVGAVPSFAPLTQLQKIYLYGNFLHGDLMLPPTTNNCQVVELRDRGDRNCFDACPSRAQCSSYLYCDFSRVDGGCSIWTQATSVSLSPEPTTSTTTDTSSRATTSTIAPMTTAGVVVSAPSSSSVSAVATTSSAISNHSPTSLTPASSTAIAATTTPPPTVLL
jgi:hypothetical protein